MTGTNAALRRECKVASALAMANRFGRYKPMEEKTVRKVEVVEDGFLAHFKDIWKLPEDFSLSLPLKFYESTLYCAATELAKKLKCTSEDVNRLCIAIGQFNDGKDFDTKAGVILSSLIYDGGENDYTLHTEHLHIHYLAAYNRKNVLIMGDVGDDFGYRMTSGNIVITGNAGQDLGYGLSGGKIVVRGDAGDCVGQMGQEKTWKERLSSHGIYKGGTIIVEGNAGDGVGALMKAGKITICGDAGQYVGGSMTGGEIHLEGDYAGISDTIEHGKIYHRGVLIVDK